MNLLNSHSSQTRQNEPQILRFYWDVNTAMIPAPYSAKHTDAIEYESDSSGTTAGSSRRGSIITYRKPKCLIWPIEAMNKTCGFDQFTLYGRLIHCMIALIARFLKPTTHAIALHTISIFLFQKTQFIQRLKHVKIHYFLFGKQ